MLLILHSTGLVKDDSSSPRLHQRCAAYAWYLGSRPPACGRALDSAFATCTERADSLRVGIRLVLLRTFSSHPVYDITWPQFLRCVCRVHTHVGYLHGWKLDGRLIIPLSTTRFLYPLFRTAGSFDGVSGEIEGWRAALVWDGHMVSSACF